MTRGITLALTGIATALLFAACSGDGSSEQTARYPDRPDRVPLVQGEQSSDGLRAILATADLGVGKNRVGFLVTSERGIVSGPPVRVSSRFDGDVAQATAATYHAWPYGERGLYTAELDFDRAGEWTLEIAVEETDGSTKRTELPFEVLDKAFAPSVGSKAIRSESKTVRDVESLDQLVTGSVQDPDFYQSTIAEAVTNGRPTVVVFASPAFCINQVCGPQIEVLQKLKDQYESQANFVHVDLYDNPDQIQGDPDAARINPTVREWQLIGIEWSFVIDDDGTIASAFEAFVTLDELEAALVQVL